MRTLALLAIFFLSAANAQDKKPLSPELARLKTSYQAAVTKAVAPLNATYRKELERLLESFTKTGKLDEALQVRNELETLDGKTIGSEPPEQPGKTSEAAALPLPEVGGTVWVARTGPVERLEFHQKGVMTVFMRNGKKYGGWTYLLAQDGSYAIKATGENPLPGTLRFSSKGAVLEGVFAGYKGDFKLEAGPKK